MRDKCMPIWANIDQDNILVECRGMFYMDFDVPFIARDVWL